MREQGQPHPVPVSYTHLDVYKRQIYGDKVKVVERSIMFPENLAFVSKVGLTNLPSLLVNGVIKHISLIPTVEKLREEIEEAMK